MCVCKTDYALIPLNVARTVTWIGAWKFIRMRLNRVRIENLYRVTPNVCI